MNGHRSIQLVTRANRDTHDHSGDQDDDRDAEHLDIQRNLLLPHPEQLSTSSVSLLSLGLSSALYSETFHSNIQKILRDQRTRCIRSNCNITSCLKETDNKSLEAGTKHARQRFRLRF